MYLDSPKLRLKMNIDHIEETIKLEVSIPSTENLDQKFERITASMEMKPDLALQSDRERTSKTYVIKAGWSADKFSTAIKNAVKYYVGEKYKLQEAIVIKSGDLKTRIICKNLDDFLKHVQGEEAIFGADLIAIGPKGKGLGVHLKNEHRELQLISTLSKKDFPELVKLYDFDLKQIQAEKENSKLSKASFLDSVTGKIVGALISLLLGAGIWGFIQPMIPVDNYVILSPMNKLPSDTTEIQVRWAVMKKQYNLENHVDPTPKAIVKIYLTNGNLVVEKADQESGTLIKNLKPGDYEVEIISLDGKKISRAKFVIPKVK